MDRPRRGAISVPEWEPLPMRFNTCPERSKRMHLLQHLVEPFKPKLVKPKKSLPAGSPHLTPHCSVKKTCFVNERKVDDIFLYELRSKKKIRGRYPVPRRRVYYFAGGGWQMPSSDEHWKLCAEICWTVPGTAVTIVSYPLAPNSPCEVALPQLHKLYMTIIQQSIEAEEHVIFAGDSAGANVLLSMTLHAMSQDEQGPHPDDLLLISPAVDLRAKGPSRGAETMDSLTTLRSAEENDPLLTIDFINGTARAWSGAWNPRHPRVSPGMTDVKDLEVLARAGIRLFCITGGYDVLAPDALLFKDKCIEAQVEGQWQHYERQMHCWPLAWTYGLPESKKAKDWILQTIDQGISMKLG